MESGGAAQVVILFCVKQAPKSTEVSYERSAGLEEKDGDLTQVEVDEVLGLVGHIGAEVTADDAMPGGVVLLVKFLLDEGGDVLLDVVALKGLGRDVDGVLLHVLGHVSVLHNGLSVGHDVCLGVVETCKGSNFGWK